jgi:hypothetical protein
MKVHRYISFENLIIPRKVILESEIYPARGYPADNSNFVRMIALI